MICYFDTSVLVAAVVAAHPYHHAAREKLLSMDAPRSHGVMSAHGLSEFYSVMTRAPFRPILQTSEVWRLIESTLLPRLELVTLSANEQMEVTRRCALSGWTGGKVHDMTHLRCASKAKSGRILTLNVKDFRLLASPDLLPLITAP